MKADTELAVYGEQQLVRPVVDPTALTAYHDQLTDFVQKTLKDGVDFMKIPGGSDRAALTKAGAERLSIGFGLVFSEPEILESEAEHNRPVTYRLTKWVKAPDPGKDEKERLKALGLGRNRKNRDGNWEWQVPEAEEGESLGLYRYVVKVKVCLRATGEILGFGVGSCSTMEAKYIRSPREAENTVLKMATKRAQVDGILRTLALSDRFTQDQDEKEHDKEPAAGKQAPNPQAAKTREPNQAEYAAQANEEATAYMDSLGVSGAGLDEFKASCIGLGVKWINFVLKAKKDGVGTAEEVYARLDGLKGQEQVA